MNQPTKQEFANVLFDPHEPIAFGLDDSDANKPRSIKEFIEDTKAQKFCINPVWNWRKTENICITSLLFEVDEKGLTPREQIKLFLESGLPFSTMTYSGGKSIHVILRFTTQFKSTQWSYQWWYAIARVLEKRGIIADKNAKLATQLSRVPNSIRNNNGKRQTLIMVKNRVKATDVLKWIRDHGEDVKQPIERTIDWQPKWNDSTNIDKFKLARTWTEKDEGIYSSSWSTGGHMWLFKLGVNLGRLEADIDPCINLAMIEWGNTYQTSAGIRQLHEPINKGWYWYKNNK